MKNFIGRKMTKIVKFMGDDVTIKKLSVAAVLEIQEHAKKSEETDSQGLDLLRSVIKDGVEGGEDLSEEDFNQLPLDELSKLSKAIMEFSGIAGGK
jgi:hypothetical protein